MLPPPLPVHDAAEVALPVGPQAGEVTGITALPYTVPTLAALAPLEPPRPAPPPGWPYTLASVDGAPHPVAWDYGARYRLLLADVVGGPQAPSTLGPTVAEADVYWRFALGNPAGMPLPEDAPERWRDAALSGAILASSRLLDETVARAPELSVYRAVVDGFVNPNVSLGRDEDGGLRVEHRTGGRRQRRIEAAELTEATPDEADLREDSPTDPTAASGALPVPRATAASPPRRPPSTPRRPEPDVGVGIDWRLRAEDAPPDAPLLSYGLWLATTRVALTNLRATWSFLDQTWTVVARQQLYPRVYLYSNLTSAPEEADPGRAATGVLWSLPWGTGWSVRAERAQTFPAGGEPGVRWMVYVRGEHHTPMPARDGSPLGEGGLCQPPLAARDPNRWALMNPPDPDRSLPQNCDRTGYSRRE